MAHHPYDARSGTGGGDGGIGGGGGGGGADGGGNGLYVTCVLYIASYSIMQFHTASCVTMDGPQRDAVARDVTA